MNATDIMTPDVICAAPDTPLRVLVRLMLDNHVSALPIVEHGRIVGIVSEGDLFRRVELGTEPRPSAWQALVRWAGRPSAGASIMSVSRVRALSWRSRTAAGSRPSIMGAAPEASMMSSIAASGTSTAFTGPGR